MNTTERYKKLEQYLSQENPVLIDALALYKKLDVIGRKTGILSKSDSFAFSISWWPLISILGTFSAGKSSFINQYLGRDVQSTGNQAVDDKFTVLCYGPNEEITTLPGLALDADPRFPFFGISKEIEKVDSGEGVKVDNYLQLKTTNAENIKGKILIDSPGFDADEQRSSTLKITNHIIEMSDLVLVFFDARHPEPGAMRDTLDFLVETVIQRNDSTKVLFILNQIDTAAKEDNPEEVISAWQRAVSKQGLVSGNFFTIYNESVAMPIEDAQLDKRFKRKKEVDLKFILDRMDKVSTERTYRITDTASKIVDSLLTSTLPKIQNAIKVCRRKVFMLDLVVFGVLFAILGAVIYKLDLIPQPLNEWSGLDWVTSSLLNGLISLLVLWLIIFALHLFIRSKVFKWEINKWNNIDTKVANALAYNNRFWRGMFASKPRGWGRSNMKAMEAIKLHSRRIIQKLNDQFADPSGNYSFSELEKRIQDVNTVSNNDKHSVERSDN